MAIVVQKHGGSSLADIQRVRTRWPEPSSSVVVRRPECGGGERHGQDHRPARRNGTFQATSTPPQRELDMLLTVKRYFDGLAVWRRFMPWAKQRFLLRQSIGIITEDRHR
ncbi:MAG: hypothetical protein R3C68_05905 [Myxococcota bacterium]